MRPDAVSLWHASRGTDAQPSSPQALAAVRTAARAVLAIDRALAHAGTLRGDPSRDCPGDRRATGPLVALAVYSHRRGTLFAGSLFAWRTRAGAAVDADTARLRSARDAQLAALAECIARVHGPGDAPWTLPDTPDSVLGALQPSPIVRSSWLVAAGCVSLFAISRQASLASLMLETPAAATALLSAARNILADWVLTPLRDIWLTVRYTRDDAGLADARRALDADRAALAHMAAPYATADDLAGALASAAERPWRGVLSGRLLTLLLVQAMRTKVDIQAALQAIDGLVHANALTFELLALLPVVGALWAAVGGARHLLSRLAGRSERRTRALLRSVIVDIERTSIARMASDADPKAAPPGEGAAEPQANGDSGAARRKAVHTGEMIVAVQRVLDAWHSLRTEKDADRALYADLCALLADMPPLAAALTAQRMLQRSVYCSYL